MFSFSDFQNIMEIFEESKVNFAFSNSCDNVSKKAEDTVIMNILYVVLYITQKCRFKACKNMCSSTTFSPFAHILQ